MPSLWRGSPLQQGVTRPNASSESQNEAAQVMRAGSGWQMKLEADPIFSHFVVFTAPDGTIALEPVSNATDGFNLHARGIPNVGIRELEPGETMRGSITLRLER